MEKKKEKLEITRDDSRTLKGIAIMLVIIHHFVQHYIDVCPAYLRVFTLVGPIACSIFFFLSGYGLMHSAIKDEKYWRRRFSVILIPFVLANVICLLFHFFTTADTGGVGELLMNIIGIKLVNPTYWFIHSLIFMYIGLYVTQNRGRQFKIMACLIMGVIYTLISGNIGGLSWIAFPLGIAMYGKEYLINRKSCVTVFVVSIFTLWYYNENRMLLNNVIRLANFTLMVLSFPVVSIAFRRMLKNPVFDYLGSRSMDYYLMHFIALLLIENYIEGLCTSFVFFAVSTIAMSFLFNKISHLITVKIINV